MNAPHVLVFTSAAQEITTLDGRTPHRVGVQTSKLRSQRYMGVNRCVALAGKAAGRTVGAARVLMSLVGIVSAGHITVQNTARRAHLIHNLRHRGEAKEKFPSSCESGELVAYGKGTTHTGKIGLDSAQRKLLGLCLTEDVIDHLGNSPSCTHEDELLEVLKDVYVVVGRLVGFGTTALA